MPTYQYACKDCGEQIERVQSFSDPSLTECPHCGGRLRKVYGSVGVVFKGSGFYRTDSRSGSDASLPAAGGSGDGAKSGGEKSGGEKPSTSAPAKSEGSKSGSATSSAPAAKAPAAG